MIFVFYIFFNVLIMGTCFLKKILQKGRAKIMYSYYGTIADILCRGLFILDQFGTLTY